MSRGTGAEPGFFLRVAAAVQPSFSLPEIRKKSIFPYKKKKKFSNLLGSHFTAAS